MYNVRTWDTLGSANAITSRDYYDIFDAIISATIDLGVKPLDPAEWFRTQWEEVAPATCLHYNGKHAVVIRDLSV